MYAEKYKGKIVLVIDDTIGSSEKPIVKEAYDLIKDALKWLNVNYDKKVYYKSDRLKIYYKYAEELIRKKAAYVCQCSREEMRKNRENGIECVCRNKDVKEQLRNWKKMFKLREGEAVLRIKTGMKYPDPAFRDRVLFKISDRKHPRVGNKYRVWPSLEMSWAIDDHMLGITHIIRGNDLVIETKMEKYIWNILNWKYPIMIHTGLVRVEGIEGAKISKSKAQKEVRSGEFIGWDDPRTWSIQSLRERGITKDAIRDFVEGIGLNKQDITVPVESLYSSNRKLIDAEANRYSFVRNPIELKIIGKTRINEIKVPIHPEKKKTRKIKVEKIFISEEDFEKFKNKEIRLIHLYNVKLKKNQNAEFLSIENKDIQKLNWVSKNINARILMPNGVWIKGIAEESIGNLKKGEIIQFERFGFCRFDRKNKNNYEFWFAHK